jgi:hypothetical protein
MKRTYTHTHTHTHTTHAGKRKGFVSISRPGMRSISHLVCTRIPKASPDKVQERSQKKKKVPERSKKEKAKKSQKWPLRKPEKKSEKCIHLRTYSHLHLRMAAAGEWAACGCIISNESNSPCCTLTSNDWTPGCTRTSTCRKHGGTEVRDKNARVAGC